MNDDKLSQLMARARGHEPFDTGRVGFGLETRILARLREARENGEGGLMDDLRKWIWRSAFGVAPVVVLLLVWLCLWSGLTVDSFAYDAVGDLAAYLPID